MLLFHSEICLSVLKRSEAELSERAEISVAQYDAAQRELISLKQFIDRCVTDLQESRDELAGNIPPLLL